MDSVAESLQLFFADWVFLGFGRFEHLIFHFYYFLQSVDFFLRVFQDGHQEGFMGKIAHNVLHGAFHVLDVNADDGGQVDQGEVILFIVLLAVLFENIAVYVLVDGRRGD